MKSQYRGPTHDKPLNRRHGRSAAVHFRLAMHHLSVTRASSTLPTSRSMRSNPPSEAHGESLSDEAGADGFRAAMDGFSAKAPNRRRLDEPPTRPVRDPGLPLFDRPAPFRTADIQALFLDRDGTLIEDRHFVGAVEHCPSFRAPVRPSPDSSTSAPGSSSSRTSRGPTAAIFRSPTWRP